MDQKELQAKVRTRTVNLLKLYDALFDSNKKYVEECKKLSKEPLNTDDLEVKNVAIEGLIQALEILLEGHACTHNYLRTHILHGAEETGTIYRLNRKIENLESCSLN